MPTDTPLDLPALLQAAKRGDSEALGPLFESIRPQLKNLARKMGSRNGGRGDLLDSDFVQETLMTVFLRFGQFQGETVEQLLSWAAAIMGNVFCMELRRLYAAKRDVRRQEPLECDGRKVDVIDPARRSRSINSPAGKRILGWHYK